MINIIKAGGGKGAAAVLKDDLIVAGVNFGGIEDGMEFKKGTEHEDIFRAQMGKANPPTYNYPSLALSGTLTKDVEAGTNLAPTLSAQFNQNDGGAPGAYRLTKGGILISNASPYAVPVFQIGDENIDFLAYRDYAQGPIKNTTGVVKPWPLGRIEAGTAVSNGVRYRGLRYLFYGVDQVLGSSGQIRSLTGLILGAGAGTNFTIHIPKDSVRVGFAYLDTIRDVSTVKYVEGLNAEIKNIFTKTIVPVAGANGYTSLPFKAYEYVPTAPFSQAVNYNVTL